MEQRKAPGRRLETAPRHGQQEHSPDDIRTVPARPREPPPRSPEREGVLMAATMEKTSTPGIYRRGGRYVVVYRDDTGRQRKESTRTLDEARRRKAKRITQVDEDYLLPRPRQTFAAYAPKLSET